MFRNPPLKSDFRTYIFSSYLILSCLPIVFGWGCASSLKESTQFSPQEQTSHAHQIKDWYFQILVEPYVDVIPFYVTPVALPSYDKCQVIAEWDVVETLKNLKDPSYKFKGFKALSTLNMEPKPLFSVGRDPFLWLENLSYTNLVSALEDNRYRYSQINKSLFAECKKEILGNLQLFLKEKDELGKGKNWQNWREKKEGIFIEINKDVEEYYRKQLHKSPKKIPKLDFKTDDIGAIIKNLGINSNDPGSPVQIAPGVISSSEEYKHKILKADTIMAENQYWVSLVYYKVRNKFGEKRFSEIKFFVNPSSGGGPLVNPSAYDQPVFTVAIGIGRPPFDDTLDSIVRNPAFKTEGRKGNYENVLPKTMKSLIKSEFAFLKSTLSRPQQNMLEDWEIVFTNSNTDPAPDLRDIEPLWLWTSSNKKIHFSPILVRALFLSSVLKEAPQIKDYRGKLMSLGSSENSISRENEFSDTDRKSFSRAYQLFREAIFFPLAHEIAHIYLGSEGKLHQNELECDQAAVKHLRSVRGKVSLELVDEILLREDSAHLWFGLKNEKDLVDLKERFRKVRQLLN